MEGQEGQPLSGHEARGQEGTAAGPPHRGRQGTRSRARQEELQGPQGEDFGQVVGLGHPIGCPFFFQFWSFI